MTYEKSMANNRLQRICNTLCMLQTATVLALKYDENEVS
jgi:hypothetical protein